MEEECVLEDAILPVENLFPTVVRLVIVLPRGVTPVLVRGEGIETEERCGGVVGVRLEEDEDVVGAEGVVGGMPEGADADMEEEVGGVEDEEDERPIEKARLVFVSFESVNRGRAVEGLTGVVGLDRLMTPRSITSALSVSFCLVSSAASPSSSRFLSSASDTSSEDGKTRSWAITRSSDLATISMGLGFVSEVSVVGGESGDLRGSGRSMASESSAELDSSGNLG